MGLVVPSSKLASTVNSLMYASNPFCSSVLHKEHLLVEEQYWGHCDLATLDLYGNLIFFMKWSTNHSRRFPAGWADI